MPRMRTALTPVGRRTGVSMIYLRPSGKGDSTISDAAIGWGALLNGRNGWRTLALAGGVTGLGESNPLFALERTMGVAQVSC